MMWKTTINNKFEFFDCFPDNNELFESFFRCQMKQRVVENAQLMFVNGKNKHFTLEF